MRWLYSLCCAVCLLCGAVGIAQGEAVFSVNYGTRTVTYGQREFRYEEGTHFDGTPYLYVYWQYTPSAMSNEPSLYLVREEDDSITLMYEDNYVAEDWVGYDFVSVAEEILPSRKGFFSDFSLFIMKPYGWLFLLGAPCVMFPRGCSYLWYRGVSSRRGYVAYDEAVHKPVFQGIGVVAMVLSVLWWFLT